MSDVYETGPKCPSPTTQKPAPTPTAKPSQQARPKARAKANPDVLGAGPEVILDAVPKGRTEKIEAAIATTLRGDEGMAPVLSVWGEGLNEVAKYYGASRDAIAKSYVAHAANGRGGPVSHIVHAERKAALGVEYGLYSRLATEARTVGVLGAPTLIMIGLADRSYKELMLSLVHGGRAEVDRKALRVDHAKVESEGRFHLEQVKDEGLQDRSKTPARSSEILGEKYARVAGALKLANSANAELRQQAFQGMAAEDQANADKLAARMAVFDWVDDTLGTFGNIAGLASSVGQGDVAGAIGAGGGLVTAIAMALSGDEIGKLRAKAAAHMELAGTEQARSAADRIDAFLEGLEVALEEFVAHAENAAEGQADHLESRRRDGVRMDRAAQGRAELGPASELHVPIAT
ncbi:MAG TPA: hypothetical protein PK095_18590, partial [Myxococcota bacterium]|nr:hypothetical protein [Myxococcota bacterium]